MTSSATDNECKAQLGDDKKHVNPGSSISDESMTSLTTEKLISFAKTSLFHKEAGIKSRPIVFFLRTFNSAFYGADLVDGVMDRSSFKPASIPYFTTSSNTESPSIFTNSSPTTTLPVSTTLSWVAMQLFVEKFPIVCGSCLLYLHQFITQRFTLIV